MRDRRAGAARAEQDDVLERARRQPRAKLASNPGQSVLWPTARSPSKTTVLTAPSAAASGDERVEVGTTSCLHGCVTLSPL